jgi:hypothetical protein
MPRSRPSTRTVPAALAALALVAAPAAADERERPQWRVAVADGASGAVGVYGVRDGDRLGRFRVAGPATLATLGDGRHVLATQRDQNRVDAIDGGAWSVRHDDHLHHHAVRPRLLPFRLRVPRPVHVVPHGREVAIFADGAGAAHVFGLPSLRRRAGTGLRLTTGVPHHGVAVPVHGRFVVSEAAPGAQAGALPAALTLRDGRGGTIARFGGCPEMHGEASGTEWAAFACEDGVLVVRPEGEGTAEKLAYPARDSVEQRAWSLQVDAAGRRLVGDFGERALVFFDLAAGQSRVVPVAGEIASFAVDQPTGAVLVLTTDGRLRRLDPGSGRELAVRRVVGRRFTPAFDRPAPKLAVRDGLAAVSDPRRRAVAVVSVRGLEHVRTLRVPGRPASVAFAGVR